MGLTPPHWEFVLTDLAGTVHGEFTNAMERGVTLPLNRVPTASVRIPMRHYLVPKLLSADTMLKVYRNDFINPKKLVFVGPVVGVEAQADKDNLGVTVSAAGPFWRFSKRLLKGADIRKGLSIGSVGNLREITQIATDIVNTVNGDEFTGIEMRTTTPNTPNNMQMVGPWHLKNAAEAIAELSAMVNGFDFRFEPAEPTMTSGPFPRIAFMDIVPLVGQTRLDSVFEYGTGRASLSGWSWTRSLDGVMTKGYMNAPGWPDGTSRDLIIREDGPAKGARGLYEDVLADDGIVDDDARGKILDEHLALRKQAREIITLTPKINTRPAPFTDYEVGDIVRGRAYSEGTLVFDTQLRVWGITFTLDKNDNESVSLEMTMP